MTTHSKLTDRQQYLTFLFHSFISNSYVFYLRDKNHTLSGCFFWNLYNNTKPNKYQSRSDVLFCSTQSSPPNDLLTTYYNSIRQKCKLLTLCIQPGKSWNYSTNCIMKLIKSKKKNF